MKSVLVKIRFSFLLAAVIFAFSWGYAFANGSTTKNGTVGGVSYTAKVGTNTVSQYGWNGYIEATTASSVNVVGWNSWKVREYCNGALVWVEIFGSYQDPVSPYTFAHGDYPSFPYNYSCVQYQHKISTYGDFKFQNGGSSANPTANFVEILPSGW